MGTGKSKGLPPIQKPDPQGSGERRDKKTEPGGQAGIPRDPKPPKGWAIVPGSVKHGKNKVTGYAYRHYILVRTGNRRD